MYNIKGLEEEWKRYKRKRRLPWIILIVIMVIGVAVLFSLQNSNIISKLKSVPNEHNTTKNSSFKRNTAYIDKALTTLEKKESKYSVDSPLDEEKNDESMSKTLPVVQVSPVQKSQKEKKSRKKLHIEVIDASKANNLKEIEKRFRLGHDTDDSLFLAKSYYKKRQYKKAEYWALQTNKINQNIEESWLLFAKAKVKRGHKNEAIRILNSYIERTKSIEAKVLIEKIKKGTL
jgi:tetratricopeptide (TPR) repeat protein